MRRSRIPVEAEGAKRFYAHFLQDQDGCGHNISCAEILLPLPKEIKTMEEAAEHVMAIEDMDAFHSGELEGRLVDFGRDVSKEILEVTIFEATTLKIDPRAWAAERADRERKKKEVEAKEQRRQMFEELKKEFG